MFIITLAQGGLLGTDHNAQPDAFFSRTESLYRFAQSLTKDSRQAARLLDDTYRKFLTLSPDERPSETDQAELLKLVYSVFRENQELTDEPIPDFPESEKQEEGSVRHKDLLVRLLGTFVERELPAILFALPDKDRSMLVMFYVDGLSEEDLALVFGCERSEVHTKLENIRNEVGTWMMEGAGPAERQLLQAELPDEWLGEAVRMVAAKQFVPVPPTLRFQLGHTQYQSTALTRTASPEPDDTVPVGADEQRVGNSRVLRIVIFAFLLIVMAGLGFYLVSIGSETTSSRNVIALSVEKSKGIGLALQTAEPENVEDYIQDHFGWSVNVPEIDQADLQGIGVSELVTGVAIPVVEFRDQKSKQLIPIFIFNYALLDREKNKIGLDQDVLLQIEQDQGFDIHDLGEKQVLVWRNRDDIYVAVVGANAESFRARISYAS